MEIKRLLTNICSADLDASKQFYTSLFAFDVRYDSDWFVHLCTEKTDLELGLIRDRHEIVPAEASGAISGVYLTFVVADVDLLYDQCLTSGYQIIQAPQPTPYGQKRMLLRAPEGTVCDVSTPMKV